MNVLWFLMDFCQVSYRCGLLKVGKYAVINFYKWIKVMAFLA